MEAGISGHIAIEGKYQTVSDSCSILGGFCYGRSQGSFVIGSEITPVLMRCGTVGIVRCPLGWEIHLIVPTLRSQHRLTILMVKIQQVF